MGRNKLVEIRNTLDHIEVKGQANLYYLLGAIQALDQLIAAAKNEEAVTDG